VGQGHKGTVSEREPDDCRYMDYPPNRRHAVTADPPMDDDTGFALLAEKEVRAVHQKDGSPYAPDFLPLSVFHPWPKMTGPQPKHRFVRR